MAHVPHLLLAGSWSGSSIPIDPVQKHHLERVLRMTDGETVSYTDGAGRVGEGTYQGGSVERGSERDVPPPAVRLTMAVAPPAAKDRSRFLVEKLTELGAAELVWVRTKHTEGRPPSADKAMAWMRSALEQSRGAWAMSIRESAIRDLAQPLLVADPGGAPLRSAPTEATVLIGPEGGLDPAETPPGAIRLGLGRNILRVETAAVCAAALFLCS